MASSSLLFVKGHELSQPAVAMFFSLTANIGPRGEPAVSVWTPRAEPLLRGSAQLKAYNGAFCDLCDATSFGNGTHDEVFPPSPVFISEESALSASASMAAAMTSVDAVHTGNTSRSFCIFVHISRLGRAQRVSMEVIGIYNNERLTEFLVLESSISSWDVGVTSPQMDECFEVNYPPPITFEPFKSREEVVERMYTHFVLDRSLAKNDWVFVEDENQKRRRKPAPIHCTSCGDTETTQRRRGPMGMGTLCNKCGLRWKRSQRTRTGVSALLS